MPIRKKKRIAFDGSTLGITEWTRDERCKVNSKTLSYRLKAGWPIKKAITTPPTRIAFGRPRKNKKIELKKVEAPLPTVVEVKEAEPPDCRKELSKLIDTSTNGRFELHIVFGKELVKSVTKKEFDKIGFEDPHIIGELLHRIFANNGEREAYLQGIDDARLSIWSLPVDKETFKKLAEWHEIDGYLMELAGFGSNVPEGKKLEFHRLVKRLKAIREGM